MPQNLCAEYTLLGFLAGIFISEGQTDGRFFLPRTLPVAPPRKSVGNGPVSTSGKLPVAPPVSPPIIPPAILPRHLRNAPNMPAVAPPGNTTQHRSPALCLKGQVGCKCPALHSTRQSSTAFKWWPRPACMLAGETLRDLAVNF